MKLPENTARPFFAYGAFKPGELAFLQIKDLTESCRFDCAIRGELLVRDGLPIAAPDGQGEIRGVLIAFRKGSEDSAYRRIVDLEPDKQYRWAVARTDFGEANYLAGRSPNKGSVQPDEEWCGRHDPLFTVALDVVEETLKANRKFEWDLKPLFRLEMAYLLLWTSIERYASLRYHLGDKATPKVGNLAEEAAFRHALLEYAGECRVVQRADDPTQRCTLDRDDPSKAVAYYYQVRSNMVHRGKGVDADHYRVEKSLSELLAIFRMSLDAAFEESKWPTERV